MKMSGLLISLAPILACGTTTPGARPHEMSSAQHEEAVQGEQKIAAEHAEKYDPEAEATRVRCPPNPLIRRGVDQTFDVCWTSLVNPTDAHRREAEEHQKHAADHRAGSDALVAAETQACAGISPEDRDMSPLEHTEDIVDVAPLMVTVPYGKNIVASRRLMGAVVTFRAVPGMTVEWLQQVVDCHLARNASLGHKVPEMASCPLVPRGASAKVSSNGNGFAVSIQGEDIETAEEVLARARKLVTPASVKR